MTEIINKFINSILNVLSIKTALCIVVGYSRTYRCTTTDSYAIYGVLDLLGLGLQVGNIIVVRRDLPLMIYKRAIYILYRLDKIFRKTCCRLEDLKQFLVELILCNGFWC